MRGTAAPASDGTVEVSLPVRTVGSMPCVVCTGSTGRSVPLCAACLSSLRPGGDVRLPGGGVARAAFRHEGAARRLVHLLKYGGLPAAARVLGAAMADVAGPAEAVVPVPRALVRRWRYGIDPAVAIAAEVASMLGIPVIAALRPGWWHPRRAGGPTAVRGLPRFALDSPVPRGAVLIDDVVTTGTTLACAAEAAGRILPALVATASPRLPAPSRADR